MSDRYMRSFASAEKLRGLADKEEQIANSAELDGDHGYADLHRRKAAEYREAARLKEAA